MFGRGGTLLSKKTTEVVLSILQIATIISKKQVHIFTDLGITIR